ncbi:MAG: hypothetical protein R3C44_04285 [Chloroflexota bacterium]
MLQQPAAKAVSWLGNSADPFLPATRLTIPPLSSIESRLLAADLLRPASSVPQRLIDLVVAEAHGNPWAIEETVKHMIDLGIIIPGTRWQFDLAQAESLSMPQSLTGLVAERLQQMPEPDRQVLDAASAVGTVFWDTALMALLAEVRDEHIVLESLSSFECHGMDISGASLQYREAQAYFFARPLTRKVALDALPAELQMNYAHRLLEWQAQSLAFTGNAHWSPVSGDMEF